MGGIVDAVKTITEGVVEVVGKAVKTIGGDVLDDALGLDRIGKEVERWGEDIEQVGKVLSGRYHDDVKILQEKREYIDEKASAYNAEVDKLVDKLDSLIAFHEIFQMSASNKLDAYVGVYGPQLDALIAEYKEAVARLKSEYDFVIGLTEGSFLEKLVGSLIMIIGGIMSDLGDILKGKADGATWKRVVTNALLVAAILYLWWFPPVGWTAMSVAIAMSLAVISAFMAMDGMYANGAATGAIMGMLDTIFNDVLNLDDLIGKDFDKFDKDHEDYQEMVSYVQLAITLAQIYNAYTAGNVVSSTSSSGTSLTVGAQMLEEASAGAGMSLTEGAALTESVGYAGATEAGTVTSYAGGLLTVDKSNLMQSTAFGVKAGTYSSLYKALTTAQSINDVVAQNEAYEQLKTKLEEDKAKLEEAITSKTAKSFTKSYKDVSYFLQDQQEYIDRYVWGMTAQNMYVDPYGTTPVANIRFTPDKDTRMMSFGYEDVFDGNKQAGSKGYFNSILYE